MTIWTRAERTPVFLAMGNFDDDQRKRYARAPFDLVQADLNGDGAREFFIETVGVQGGLEDLVNSTAAIDDADFPFQARTGYGYLTQPAVFENSGFGNGQDDGWRSQHYFGQI